MVYLVNEQERYSEDGQLQSNDKAYGEGGECFLVGKQSRTLSFPF